MPPEDIAHEYGEIKQERIWTVVSSNIPELIEKLEPLVKSFQQGNSSSEGLNIESTKQEDDKNSE
jgi:hypothetical protein